MPFVYEMADYVENYLILQHGDRLKLQDAIEAYRNGGLLAYLCPEIWLDPRIPWDGGASGAGSDIDEVRHVWREKHWGTDRDVCHIAEREPVWEKPDQIALRFDTATAAPLPAYESAVSRHGFRLVAYYHSRSDEMCGKYTSEGLEQCFDYGDGQEVPGELLERMPGVAEALKTL